MNGTFFRLKRAHHSALRASRALLGAAITPARFDMLLVILMHGDRYGILQSDLRERLGVSAPVVSRMLDSLDELRFVWRELDEDDGRRRVISLTPEGRALVLRLLGNLLGHDDLAIDCALGGDRWWDASYCADERSTLIWLLRGISRTFLDGATLEFDAAPS